MNAHSDLRQYDFNQKVVAQETDATEISVSRTYLGQKDAESAIKAWLALKLQENA